jgi:thiol-disulfide isomerase/thioredoxin
MNTIKNFYYILVILFVFNSCSNNSFSVEANTNHNDDLNIFLVKIGDSNLPVVIDSTKVVNGKFIFNDTISIPEMHYIVFENQRENLPVVLEPGTIKINVYKDSIRSSKVNGTKSNDDFNSYKTKTKEFYLELNNIQKEISQANFQQDSVLLRDLSSQFETLRAKLLAYEESFIVENNDSYMASLILQRMVMNQEIDFNKTENYFSRFTETIKKTKSAQETKKRINEIKDAMSDITIGTLAPNFTGPGLDGNPISLSDVKSKVILLDFWASWCAPCRIENPDLVKLKNKYSSEDFEIVGVSLDRDKNAWTTAIINDNIENWVHISNLKFWGEPIAKIYGLLKMPTSYLLDSNRNVIGIDLKGNELDKSISDQINK